MIVPSLPFQRKPERRPMAKTADDIALLEELERKILWLATWTIHNANHVRPSTDGLKVGGHQASSASMATIMTALYLKALRPEDRVAVKPHASPIFHAIQYLAGHQTREKLENFRGYKGAQSYPRAPRTSTTSTSPPARSASAWRRPCSPRWCRTICAPRDSSGPASARACPRARWSRSSATPRWTRATSSKPCWKAGSTACATPGGSSTTTARASTPWCAKGCGSASNPSSAISAGTSSS